MTFPSTYLNVTVEVALGADLTASPSTWAWSDVTEYVRARDLITITRGGFDGSTQAPPSTCQFTVDNRDGRWVPTNPTGAWYGQLKLNTPIRVRTNEGSSSVRWTGFLSSLPPRWNDKETDRYVVVTASGILQRLQRGSTPLRSPLFRTIAPADPVAYWPAEDGASAATLAEFSGGPAMTWVNTLTPGSDGPAGSSSLPEFTSAAGVRGDVPLGAATNQWGIFSVFNFPASPSAAVTLLRWNTTGTYPVWEITLTPGSPDVLTIVGRDAAGTIQISDAVSFTLDGAEPFGEWLYLCAAAVQDGTGVDYFYFFGNEAGGQGFSGNEASISAGNITAVIVPASVRLDGMHAGHWSVWDQIDDIDTFPDPVNPVALGAHDGETVTIRVGRISQETPEVGIEQIELDLVNKMGPQSQDTFLSLAREAEAVTNGRLVESRDPTTFDALLQLYMHDALSNQDATLTLDHDSGHLSLPFDPVDDDQQLRNDWTVTRSGASGSGSSARVIATLGEHSSLTPNGVGTYADSTSVNVQTDDLLRHQAGWRVNVGTVEGLRFPAITLDFARNPALIADWIGCDIGSRITISNPPEGIAPDDIDLLIEGWTETLGPKEWRVNINCSPYGPWHVFQLAEDSGDTDPYLGRLAGDEKCALRQDLTSSATGSVNMDPNFFRWTTIADDFPLNIRLGGEVVTLSGMSTSAASYVAAGAASHADNAAVTPALYAGNAVRQLILVFAAIRSSGTGTLVTPTGYTRLPVFHEDDNVQLFAKVHTGTESDPTVTPAGGSAGDTVSAFTFGLSGVPCTLGLASGTSLEDIVLDRIVQLNASAANIAYGGLYPWQYAGNVQLILGWKQDDYTSVAVPTGFTEILEASTGTGSDQSLYAAYKIDTTPTVTPEGSLAVTGGASAISRSAVVSLAGGIQIMTVDTRGVNGVTKAHSAGTLIAVEDPAVLAL